MGPESASDSLVTHEMEMPAPFAADAAREQVRCRCRRLRCCRPRLSLLRPRVPLPLDSGKAVACLAMREMQEEARKKEKTGHQLFASEISATRRGARIASQVFHESRGLFLSQSNAFPAAER